MSGVKIKRVKSNEPPKSQNSIIQEKSFKRKAPCPMCGKRLFDVVDNSGGGITIEIKCPVCKNIVYIKP